jgi:hypothetical protein
VLSTQAAAGALRLVNVPRFLADGDLEVAGLPLDRDQFAVGEQFDVGMLARARQPGRDRAHGAVVGRKGLVQPGHRAADGRRFFQQIDLQADIGHVQGGLHPPDAAADHQRRADLLLFHAEPALR